MMTVSEAIAAADAAALTAALRADLLANHVAIPALLKQRKAWLVWQAGSIDPARRKFGKVPIYPSQRRKRAGAQGSPEDRSALGTWDEAWNAFQSEPSLAGVGLAMLPDCGIVALDADNCVPPNASAEAVPDTIMQLCGITYTERSPSGSGVRAFWLGEARDAKNHAEGVELFHSTGFVTVTGNRLAGSQPEPLSRDHAARLEAKAGARPRPEAPTQSELSALMQQALSAADLPRVQEALSWVPADDRDTWVRIGHALKTMGDAAKPFWHQWSATSAKYDAGDAERVWASFQPTQTSHLAIFAEAKRHGWTGGAPLATSAPASHPKRLDLRALPLVPPPVPFVIPGWLPAGVVTLLAAHGGAGKSFLALYIAVCLAAGRHPFDLSQSLPRQRVLFYSAEDGMVHLQGRLRCYLSLMGIDAADLEDWLFLLDATGCDNVLFRADKAGTATTERFDWLANEANACRADVVIFDNASDAMDANENDRAAVRQFMAALRSLERTVLLLAHVDAASSMAKAGEGKGYSGSTAWNNSARSRWLLTRDAGGGLVLQQPKVNYARAGSEVLLQWNDDHKVFTVTGCYSQAPNGEAHRSLLLRLLSEALAEGADISPYPTANNNLNRALRLRPDFPTRLDNAAIRRELGEWQRLGFVRIEDYRKPNRQTGQRLALTEKGQAIAAANDGATSGSDFGHAEGF